MEERSSNWHLSANTGGNRTLKIIFQMALAPLTPSKEKNRFDIFKREGKERSSTQVSKVVSSRRVNSSRQLLKTRR